MKFIPEKTSAQVGILCLLALGLLGLNGLTTYFAGARLMGNLEKTRTAGIVLRNHTIANMAQAGMRGTVYAALATDRTGVTKNIIDEELATYILTFSKTVRDNQNLNVSPQVHGKIEAIKASVNDYVGLAMNISELAFSDGTKALAALPKFEESFKRLQTTMDEIGDSIETDAADIEMRSRAFAATAQFISAIMLALAIASVLALSGYVTMYMLRRLKGLEQDMLAIAAGKLDTAIGAVDRRDEIGDMSRAVVIFQDNALERQRLESETRKHEAQIAQARGQAEREKARNETLQAAITREQAGLIDLLGGALDRLACGDLTVRLPIDADDVFRQVKEDVNTMADQIRAIAERIVGVSNQVQGATRDIASGMADLSIRTEHQATSLEETAISMDELAKTVKRNCENARDASQLADAASASAADGSGIAAIAMASMNGIEESSRQFGDFVGLIQDIAVQTNLLALNAAVEAARAGDSGRGFAVVANEVRALAQRAGQASKDIKGLIAKSGAQVSEGVILVTRAGSALAGIVASTKTVAGLVSEIAAASIEQSSGIEQVSKAVAGMDEMTQQNAALVGQANSALRVASTQVEDLCKAVSFFQTGEAGRDGQQEQSGVRSPTANPLPLQLRQLNRRTANGGSTMMQAGWKGL